MARAELFDRLIFGKPKRQRDIPFGPVCPDGVGFNCKSLTIERPDGVTLQGWHGRVGRTSAKKVLIYFGGRCEDVFWAPKMASHWPDWNVYAFNYRGFGSSTGSPSEKNAQEDAIAILDTVLFRHRNVDHESLEIVVMGRSLGTATACWLAGGSEKASRIDRVILLSPFSSIHSVLKAKKLTAAAAPLVKSKFRSIDLAPRIMAPTSVIVSQKDITVTHTETSVLHQAISEHLRSPVIRVPRTNHATLPRAKSTLASIAGILGT